MPITAEQILQDSYFFEDHPLNPRRMVRGALDFGDPHLSLLDPLNPFTAPDVADFFASVGELGRRCQQIENFLVQTGYPEGGGRPPAFFIGGERGVGLTSLAYYVAYSLKNRMDPEPGLDALQRSGDNIARVLLLIKSALQEHYINNRVEGYEALYTRYGRDMIDPRSPDLDSLVDFFVKLAQKNLGAPLLIQIIEGIEYRVVDWVETLCRLLLPVNVMPIFLANDLTVIPLMEAQFKKAGARGLVVTLEGLNLAEICSFLKARLPQFRLQNVPEGRKGLFPFSSEFLERAFTSESQRMEIGHVVRTCDAALNRKLAKVSGAFNADAGKLLESIFDTHDLLLSVEDLADGIQAIVNEQ